MDYSVPIELTNEPVRDISFQVLADVYKNNLFSCDITSSVISIDNIVSDLEFKEKGSVLGKPSVNTATITLDNTNGLFSPNNINNIESQYPDGQFRTNTPIKILAGFKDTNNQSHQRILFQGLITAFKNKITRDSKQSVLTLKDYAVLLQRMKVPNHTYKYDRYYEAVLFDVTIDEAVSYLIDYGLGGGFPRTLHAMKERLPIVEFTIGNSMWQTLLESQYTFNASNIQDFTEEVDFDNIKNKWKITSNPKTMQLRQILVGTPSSSTVTMVDDYWSTDGKNALGADNKTLTLKSQDQTTFEWINSDNVPLVYTQTYSDLIKYLNNSVISEIKLNNILLYTDDNNDIEIYSENYNRGLLQADGSTLYFTFDEIYDV